MIETDAVVRIAETGTERFGRGRLGGRGHRAIAFYHRSRLAVCQSRSLVSAEPL